MSGKVWFNVIVPSNAVRAAISRTNPSGLLLVNEAIRLADEFLALYTIARDQALFGDCPPLTGSLEQCYNDGVNMGIAMVGRVRDHYGQSTIKAYMGPNEATPATIEGAAKRGAFEAGVANAVHAFSNADYIASNFSVGTPKGSEAEGYGAPIFVAFWREFHRLCLKLGRVKLGYHGYSDWQSGAYWMERRPWTIWKPAIETARLPWVDVIITEAGTDLGPHILPNGYHNVAIGSQQQAAYIKDMPNGYFKEAIGICLFGLGLTDDWPSFDMLGDDVVLDAITEANTQQQNGGDTMPNNLAHEIWDTFWRWPRLPEPEGYNPNTAIGAYRERNPSLGAPLCGEFTLSHWPVVGVLFANGLVMWGKQTGQLWEAHSESQIQERVGPLA